MAVGTVVWFDDAKGYGFISCEDESDDVFVHYTGINGEGYRTLKRNWIVNFEKVLCNKNRDEKPTYMANNVKPIIKN